MLYDKGHVFGHAFYPSLIDSVREIHMDLNKKWCLEIDMKIGMISAINKFIFSFNTCDRTCMLFLMVIKVIWEHMIFYHSKFNRSKK